MRRDHRQQQLHEDPFARRLAAEYGERVAAGVIEARVATLSSGAAYGLDRLSAEHLARSEVASLAAAPAVRRHGRR